MKKILFIACSLLLAISAGAQGMKDPSTWTIKSEPADGMYRMIFHVSLQPGWHIWALNPGGDGSLIPPSFTFAKGAYTLEGETGEQGISVEGKMDGINGTVNYYMSEVQFTQMLKAKKGDVVKGEYTYQLCSDKVCLPPKTIPFSYRIP